jgi:hypothetical protein
VATDLPPLKPLPFQEAVDFFRGKLNLPTESWRDLERGMHARAFVVAGAQKAELLAGFREAIDSALTKGTTIQDFRKRFDQLVKEHGWSHTGNPGWRSRVIYETNLRTAYQAGRYKQMTTPEMLAGRPWWEYRHGNPLVPRQEHQAWNGKVLAAGDPWWDTHYPPNGWGCTCKVFTLSQADLERLGKTVWQDPPDGGVPPEWSYNVGEAAWGRKVAASAAEHDDDNDWVQLSVPGWKPGGPAVPGPLPAIPASSQKLPVPRNRADALAMMENVLGAKEKKFTIGSGNWEYPVMVNPEGLLDHFYKKDPGRTVFFSMAMDALKNPQEAWMGFFKNKATNLVALRVHVLSTVSYGKKEKGITVVLNAQRGMLTGWTLVPSRPGAIAKKRLGKLIAVGKKG